MPGIIDSHVHVTMGAGLEYTNPGVMISCNGKEQILDFMADFVRKNPGQKVYPFGLEKKRLEGAVIEKEDLDAICPDSALVAWSSDDISYGTFKTWSPYLGMEAGKDADFLVFDKDLMTAEHEGFSYNLPKDVYFRGKKLN